MRKETIAQLKKKGWSLDDIRKAEDIIASRAVKDKSKTTHHFERVLYWTVILVIIIGNFIVSLGITPILLAMNQAAVDVIIILLGFAFGLLFNLLILDLEFVSKKHHLIALVIIPLAALINLSVIVNITNAVNDVLQISNVRNNPITMSVLYVLAFLAPYLWTVLVKKKI